jgi:hypothetical protein
MTPTNEIFILYGSPGIENQYKEWNSFLKDNLTASISQLIKDKPEIKLASFDHDAAELTKAKVVVFSITPDDLSDNAFKEKLTRAAEKITAEQICFTIIQSQLNINNLPGTIKTNSTYTFFDIDDNTGLQRNYKPAGSPDETKLYWSKVFDLAYDLTKSLLPGKKMQDKKAVYLAETTPDQYESRDAIRSELIHRGFEVYPSHILSGNFKEISEQISEYLEKSFMSVHIAGRTYGELIPGGEFSLLELQYRLAAKRWKDTSTNTDTTEFQRLVWLQPGLKPADERQRWFIGSLRIEEKNAYTEIMQTPIEELKNNVIGKLKAYKASSQNIASNELRQSIYLIYEQKDSEKISDLKQFLEKNELKVLSLVNEIHTDNIVTKHYEYLTNAESILICDFDSNRQWINSKLKDLIKAPGRGRKIPFKATAIYSKQKTRYTDFIENNDCLVLDANSKINEAFGVFFKKLKQQ